MGFGNWFRSPRHLLAMFLGIAVVSAAALGLVGWQLILQDRRDVREREAVRAETVLQKHFSEVEEELSTLLDTPDAKFSKVAAEYAGQLSGHAVLLVFHKASMEALPAGRLLYYPILPETETPAAIFEAAQTSEVQHQDSDSAISRLNERAHSPEALVHVESLLQLAHIHRTTKKWTEAEADYEQLKQFGNLRIGPNHESAELVARRGICNMLEEKLDSRRLNDEVSALNADLNDSRWPVTVATYDSYKKQIGKWLGDVPAPSPDRVALSDAAQELWNGWQNGSNLKERQAIWVADADRSVLLITRKSGDRAVAFAATPETIETWIADVAKVAAAYGTRIALTDIEGNPVVGRAGPAGDQAERAILQTGLLPWKTYAISNPVDVRNSGLTLKGWLVVIGLFALTLLVVGGCYLTGRAVAREIAMTRLESDFVAAVSHEFRTPLTVLRQLSELLAKGRVVSPDVQQQCYDVMEHESTRLQRLVEGLIKFGRMEAGAMRYEFETVDTGALLGTLLDEFGVQANRHGCRIELTASGSALPVRADREALSCVVWNLLDNAIKYSPDCRTVWIDLAREDGNVAIRVRDHGVGIPQKDHHRIFEKFVRGEVANTLGVQGTGIGLAVARQIIVRHGGEIRLESQPGSGSTFTVLLPVAEA